MHESQLMHYGVKGMKWGVRRYQNKDGSLTSLGKTKYGSSENSAKNERDHSKSDKSPLAIFMAEAAFDVATLNVLGLGLDAVRLAQAINSEAKTKKFEKERIGCETDPNTGFLLKNKNRSIEEDIERVNPSVKNFDGNTKNNCMLCTCTYDLRRRGYEVSANKASVGYFKEDLKAWYPKVKVTQCLGETNREMRQNVKDRLLAQGEGARGNLMINWKGFAVAGHSVAYEVKDGKLLIIDAQINKVYKNPDTFLKQCKNIVEVARLDNLTISKKNIKEVAH